MTDTEVLPGLEKIDKPVTKRQWYVTQSPQHGSWYLTDGPLRADFEDFKEQLLNGNVTLSAVLPSEAKARYWCEQLNEVESRFEGKALLRERKKITDGKAFEKDLGFRNG